jgi:hypothetical protein
VPRHAVHAPAATARPAGGSGDVLALDPLFDRAEHAVAGGVEHLDPHQVAERHERRGRLAVAQVSTVRCSAKQEAPSEVSSFATVPEPTIVPADNGRVFAACATSWAKSNCMSTPASGAPNHVPLIWVTSGRCSLLSRQAAPNSSGVTNTGLSARTRLALQEAETLGQLVRDQVAQRLTSLTRPMSWMCDAACSGVTRHRHVVGDDHDSASRSMP